MSLRSACGCESFVVPARGRVEKPPIMKSTRMGGPSFMRVYRFRAQVEFPTWMVVNPFGLRVWAMQQALDRESIVIQ